MSTNHWHGLFNAWSKLATPVRVSAEVIAAIKAEVAAVTGPILVLGLTSGLMDAGPDSIPEFFDARFPDRDRLAAATGWDRAEIDTVDIYRKSGATYAFPTRKQLLSVLPPAFTGVRFIPVPDHPLGDEWPVLAMEVR